MKESLSKILSKIEELTNTNKVEKSVNFCLDRIDKFDEKLNMLSKILDDHENRINHVETYCKNIMSKVKQVKAYNNFLEQQLLDNNLEISGISFTTNENLLIIMDHIAKELKIDFEKNTSFNHI